jgi:hypothetical protein
VKVDSRIAWIPLVSLYDEKAAHTLATLLNDEAVPTQVAAVPKLIGESHVWEVSVQNNMFDHAQHLLSQSRFTDAELEYLATGVLRSDDSNEPSA